MPIFWTILNGTPQQAIIAGTGSNNEFALSEVSQWLEERYISHVPRFDGRCAEALPDDPIWLARCGYRRSRCSAHRSPETWKFDTAARWPARKIKTLSVIYVSSPKLTRQTSAAESPHPEEDMRKAAKFLREWLGQMSIAEDEDGLVTFVKRHACRFACNVTITCAIAYSHDHYPQKEVVQSARKS